MISDVMPSLFMGHGNPMNALHQNSYSQGWAAIAQGLPTRPKAVLVISAHWMTPRTAVTVSLTPQTLHDFGNFPAELFAFDYPAPGSPALALRVQELLAPQTVVALESEWGLDHGAWSVLCHLFPKADVPVVQLSLDYLLSPAGHYALGQRLAVLRQEGVLILGSGNIVHNLRTYAWQNPAAPAYEWASRFEAAIESFLSAGDDQALIHFSQLGEDALLAVPTPEHYLPLLYVAATRRPEDTATFPVRGMDGGSISMLSVQLGAVGG